MNVKTVSTETLKTQSTPGLLLHTPAKLMDQGGDQESVISEEILLSSESSKSLGTMGRPAD